MQYVYRQMRGARGFMPIRAFVAAVLLFVMVILTTQIAGSMQYASLPSYNAGGNFRGFQMGMMVPGSGMPQKAPSRLLPTPTDDESQNESEEASAKTIEATITVDGVTNSYLVAAGTTVAELLEEQQIEYDEHDRVSPPLEKELRKDTEIVLKRVAYESEMLEEELPFEQIEKDSSLLKEGKSRVVQQGKMGRRTVTYVQCFVDGQLESETEEDVTVHAEPMEEVTVVGAPVAISPLEFEDIELDENGVPVSYSHKLTEQVATGYSARRGAKTASGRYAITGHVAVDPEDIPYGSRLYITTSDNSFVYGCAVAADTGVGLLQDVIDVDLFYDTYRESALNGRKIVDIYVLD